MSSTQAGRCLSPACDCLLVAASDLAWWMQLQQRLVLLLVPPVCLERLPAEERCLLQGCAQRVVPVARLLCGAMRQKLVLRHLCKYVLAHAGAQGAPGDSGAAQSLPASMGCQIAGLQVPVLDCAVAQSLLGTSPAAERLPGPRQKLQVVQRLWTSGLAHAAALAVCSD